MEAVRNFMTNKDKKKGNAALANVAREWIPYFGRDVNAAYKPNKVKSDFSTSIGARKDPVW